MNKIANEISKLLLPLVQTKFSVSVLNVPEVKLYWHNCIYLLFTAINHRRLFPSKQTDIAEMCKLKLIPKHLLDFYVINRAMLDSFIKNCLTLIENDNINMSALRQAFLNIELCFSDGHLSLFSDKVSRDNTGSYYTPRNLTQEIIKIALKNKYFDETTNYHIADFSCGCGDFFQAISEYLDSNFGIPCSTSAKWFYGIDIDPIALQICVVNLLMHADRTDWGTIIDHFTFGNPLIVTKSPANMAQKNKLYATGRLYSTEMGLEPDFFECSFDIIVGNPPWEKIRFEERKFFKGISDEISGMPQKAMRDKVVEKLKSDWPIIYQWRGSLYDDYSKFNSKKYNHPKIHYAIRGELNTYALFTELAYNMLKDNGVLALVVKSTLVTAPTNKTLWQSFLTKKSIKGIYIFENSNKIFDIDSRERFAVFIAENAMCDTFEFMAGLTDPSMLESGTPISITSADLSTINPYTSTIPNVKNTDEIAFLKDAHKKYLLFDDVYPDCHFGRLIHLTAQSAFIDKQPSEYNVPIYEGKFIEQYDARYSTFKGLSDVAKYANKASAIRIEMPDSGEKPLPECRFFVQKSLWNKYLSQYKEKYSLCWRSLTSPTNRRTMLAMILPTCPTCQSIQLLQVHDNESLLLLLGLFNSIPFDYFVRIKMPGLDLTQSVIKQIPVPNKQSYERITMFYGRKASLKTHIFSYMLPLLMRDSRLIELIDYLKDKTYDVQCTSSTEAQQKIDLLFKEAYLLDNQTYANMVASFPKYEAAHSV